ncbi:hypothetical protein BDR05DRAFT_999152 [Suillus weaverae]|nr:hypothetical protein BDR05DRAFT_999152 [Suillus weaverae]
MTLHQSSDAATSSSHHLLPTPSIDPLIPLILTLALLSFPFLLPVLPLIPLCVLFFVLGVFPFIWTHPVMQARILPLLKAGGNASTILTGITSSKYAAMKIRLRRWIDDDTLYDKHWGAEMWEHKNTKDNLDAMGSGFDVWDEFRSALLVCGSWDVEKDTLEAAGVEWAVNNLTFSLAPGCEFVETEGWRLDALGSWVSAPSVSVSGSGDPIFGVDDNGWVYTNTVWADLRRIPLEAWKALGMARRRWWV